MAQQKIWKFFEGTGPLIATAIHDGHALRGQAARLMGLSDAERLREEDPFTGLWTTMVGRRILVHRSRFEVDLNRPRESAVYLKPEDAWGLEVWRKNPSRSLINASLAEYDAFYTEVSRILTGLAEKYRKFVVFDLHSFNFRRGGPESPPDNPELNPEVNIGTGTMDREKWAPLVNRFIDDLKKFNYRGRSLDVRENIKFRGGQFSRWIHQEFPESGCSIAVEFKKFFMDEWTGKPDRSQLEDIRLALESTVPGVLRELSNLGGQGIE